MVHPSVKSGAITKVMVLGMSCAQTTVDSIKSFSAQFVTGDGFQCGRISGTDVTGKWACKTGDREFSFEYGA